MIRDLRENPTWQALKNTLALLQSDGDKGLWWIFFISLISGIIDLFGLAILLLYLRIALSFPPSFLEPYVVNLTQVEIAAIGGFGVIGFILIKNILSTYSSHSLNKYIFTQSKESILKAYHYTLSMSYSDFRKYTYSDISASINGEIRRAYIAAAQPFITLIRDVTIIIMLLTLVMFINPAITSILFCLALFFLILNLKFIRKNTMELALRTEESIIKSRKWLDYSLRSYVDIKLSGMNRFKESYEIATIEDTECQLKMKDADYIPLAQNELILTTSVVIIVLYITMFVNNIVDIFPVLVIFAFAGLRILSLMGRIFIALKAISVSSYLVKKVISLKHRIRDQHMQGGDSLTVEEKISPIAHREFKNEIRLEDISYTYDDEAAKNHTIILNNLSLTIQKGSFIGFVGPSGGGKTTLIKIILGLLEPTSGRVMWDEINLKNEYEKKRLWQNIGYVSQDPVVLPLSIRDNITATSTKQKIKNASDKDIWASLKYAQMDEFVRSLENGLDTVLQGEHVSLSGGQKQRLVLARLFYNKPKIIILDEATSALDYQTEYAIMQSIKEMRDTGCTVLSIAHRLSTIKDADTLFLIDNGQLIAHGRFEELIKHKLFQKLAGQEKK